MDDIYAMAGATLRHAQSVRNCLLSLQGALRSRGGQALGPDVRLFVQKTRLFTVPDVLVVCGAPVLGGAERYAL